MTRGSLEEIRRLRPIKKTNLREDIEWISHLIMRLNPEVTLRYDNNNLGEYRVGIFYPIEWDSYRPKRKKVSA